MPDAGTPDGQRDVLICVQCDGGRPGCQRCIKYRTPCPGYRDHESFKFVSENYNVQVLSLRSKRYATRNTVRGTERSPLHFSSLSTTRKEPTGADHWSKGKHSGGESQDHRNYRSIAPVTGLDLIIGKALLPCWEDRSVNLFFRDFTLAENEDGSSGYLSFLPDMYEKSKKDSGLALAVQASSYAAMANRSNISWLEEKARSLYGKALTAVNQRLRQPREAIEDDTILTILLLIFFEVRPRDLQRP